MDQLFLDLAYSYWCIMLPIITWIGATVTVAGMLNAILWISMSPMRKR